MEVYIWILCIDKQRAHVSSRPPITFIALLQMWRTIHTPTSIHIICHTAGGHHIIPHMNHNINSNNIVPYTHLAETMYLISSNLTIHFDEPPVPLDGQSEKGQNLIRHGSDIFTACVFLLYVVGFMLLGQVIIWQLHNRNSVRTIYTINRYLYI